MAIKKKKYVKNKKSEENVLNSNVKVQGKNNNSNKMISRILVAVVVLACLWEVFQTIGNQEVPQLKTNLVMKFDSGTKGAGPFVAWGAAEVGKDKIIIADSKNNRLVMFNRKGDFLKSWGSHGTNNKKENQFNEPSGMTSDDHGNAYVLDCWNSFIKGFNEKGDEIARISLGDKGFYGPRGVDFDGNSFVVADTGSHRIVFIDPKSNIVKIWGSLGSGDDHFNNPIAVTTDKKGHYYVADMDNHRVQYLDANGKKIKYIKFNDRVSAVAVDKEGRVYVGTDANKGEVEVFNSDGNALGTLVDMAGSGDTFRNIKFMTITSDDLLLMTSDDSVYLYQLPSVGIK